MFSRDVFTWFIVEYEHSHLAVLTEIREAMEASFEKFGYMSCRDESVQSKLVICCMEWFEKLLAKSLLDLPTH